MPQSALYFVTGSSGSGKTTLLQRVQADRYHALPLFHVDALGAESNGRTWVERAAREVPEPQLLVVDGQERPHVILEAARDVGLEFVHVLLVDCDHAERRRRLLAERRQPELDSLDMYAWAAYMRGQADALGLEVLDTTHQQVDESAAQLVASLARFAERAGVAL
jgi:dephospho-CoA kinase